MEKVKGHKASTSVTMTDLPLKLQMGRTPLYVHVLSLALHRKGKGKGKGKGQVKADQNTNCLISPLLPFAHFIIYVSLPDSCRYLDLSTLTKVSMYHPKHNKKLMTEHVSKNRHLMCDDS